MKFLNFLRNLFGNQSDTTPMIIEETATESMNKVESSVVVPVEITEPTVVNADVKPKKASKPKKPKADKPVETAKEIKAKAKKSEPNPEKKVVKKSPAKKPTKKKSE